MALELLFENTNDVIHKKPKETHLVFAGSGKFTGLVVSDLRLDQLRPFITIRDAAGEILYYQPKNRVDSLKLTLLVPVTPEGIKITFDGPVNYTEHVIGMFGEVCTTRVLSQMILVQEPAN